MRVDQNGYPGTIDYNGKFDGGDTAAVIGTLIALEPNPKTAAKWIMFAEMLLSTNGLPRRHPDVSKWWGQGDRFSRDQLIPIICAAIRFPQDAVFEGFFKAHRARRFLTAWNTRKNGEMNAPTKAPDFTGPEIWALWIRYRRPKWDWLVLWFLDLELLAGAIVWKFRKDRVTRNHMLSALTCRRYMPTITSRIAFALTDFKELNARWRAHCDAVGEYQTATHVEVAWVNTR